MSDSTLTPPILPVTVDGALSEWNQQDLLVPTSLSNADFSLYGRFEDGSLNFAIQSNLAGTTIGTGTTIWLNLDQDTSTGYQIWGGLFGAEYSIEFQDRVGSDGVPEGYLYKVGANGVMEQVGDGSLVTFAFGNGGTTLEFSVSLGSLGWTGGDIDIYADINDTAYLPTDYWSGPAFTLNDPTQVVAVDDSPLRIAIVYSETTAKHGFFSEMAYSQLFMSAQNQAAMTGVPYDILTEADLTDATKLAQYDSIVFPSFSHVDSALIPGITAALTSAVYEHGVGLITAGNFLTNTLDANGNAISIPGDSYVRMKALLGITLDTFDNTLYQLEVRAAGSTNPIMGGLGDDALVRTYDSPYGAIGTQVFRVLTGVSSEVLATQILHDAAVDANGNLITVPYSPIPGTTFQQPVDSGITTEANAIFTTITGGRNVHFATEGMLADNNLLGRAIDWTVADAAAPEVRLEMSRHTAIFASRSDMDQSYEVESVNPVDGSAGIYDLMLPILEKWKADYNFVGSYYLNIGDDYTPGSMAGDTNLSDGIGTDWAVSLPYYQQLLALGNELGSHSYSHPDFTDNLSDSQLQTEFGITKQILEYQLGIPILGAAIPGNPQSLATTEKVLAYYDYLTGGNAMVGAGYPGAFGFVTPGSDKVYIAPNISSDFTQTGWKNLTFEQAAAGWLQEWQEAISLSDLPVVVFPWHDYGLTGWVTDYGTTDANGVPKTYGNEAMFTPLIEAAFNYGSEFVTLADLAARISAFAQATLHTTFDAANNAIAASVTGALGTFQLDLDTTIASVDGWYAYDADSVFLPVGGGNFTVRLGAQQVDVTRIVELPARGNLLSVAGDGLDLDFTLHGEGKVIVDPGAAFNPVTAGFSITGATATLRADGLLQIDLGGMGLHAVSLRFNTTFIRSVTTDETHTVIAGTAAPGSTVTVFDEATAIGTPVVADANGAWTLQLEPPLSDVIHSLTASAVDTLGHVKATPGLVLVGSTQGDALTGGIGVDLLLGGAGDDVMTGGAGIDTFVGGTGNDAYHVDSTGETLTEQADQGRDSIFSPVSWTLADNFEDLILTGSAAITGTGNAADNLIIGNAAASTLTGGEGNDTLDGGGGIDSLIGGAGDDTFIVDDAGDITREVVNGGTDEVRASVSWTLGANLERLVLTGGAAINGTGNALSNWIEGNAAANVLNGGGGNDTILGGEGNDTLNGGSALATLIGGLGDDVYIVDTTTDTITENPGEGTDEIRTNISWVLDANFERLVLTGGSAIHGTGNDADNFIAGNGQANSLIGAMGADTLAGGAGNDTLDGGAGDDSMVGGAGNDLYIVDSAGDVIVEQNGQDTVIASADHTLATGVETLVLAGAATVGTGNASSNRIIGNVDQANLLSGLAGNDTLEGGSQADSLFGGDGSDRLIGNLGNDWLDGGSGTDTMFGDDGNDSLLGQEGNDRLLGDAGDDALDGGAGADALLGGDGNDTLLGGTGADTQNGGAGGDLLAGGDGNDILTGGLGADIFLFNRPNEGVDRITDFNLAEDVIQVSATGYGVTLPLGPLTSLTTNTTGQANGAGQQFIYETDTGRLWFDIDGQGGAARVAIADFTGRPALDASDIIIIA